ncbi:CYTH domain-containing protein [Curtobacterium ammoniigenes]|uniref:CYTH domain-containing protein n=1 Tax=Curtobacterium ammoniigenes TaxID=395387 RepID=UPI00082A56E8|nr:CYTH domain-containing protein [Curtobacterium ammoniigenes]
MTASHLEIERTYDLPEGVAPPSLDGVATIVGSERLDPFELDATYWDTANYDLVAARVTVRRRTGGPDAGWHIKRAASDTHREEQHFPLTDDPDSVPAALLDALFIERRGRALTPIVRIQTQRTVTRLLDSAGTQIAEIADDAVTASRLDADAHGPRHWREVEVELTGVDADDASAVIGALDERFAAIGAGPAAVSSKLARGLAGASVPRLTRGEKPEKGTAARVLRKRLKRLRAELVDQASLLAQHTDGSAADIGRTAAAAVRVDALLSVYRPAFGVDPTTEAAVAAAAHLAERAARAERSERLMRDLHVAAVPAVDALVPARARARVQDRCSALRDRSIADLAAFVASQEFVTLLEVLDEVVERPAPTDWSLRTPKTVAQDVTADWKRRAQEAVQNAFGSGDGRDALTTTEAAWHGTTRLRLGMEALGDDAYPHALLRRVTAASDVLTVRAQALFALTELQQLAAGEARVDPAEAFGLGALAAERARAADDAHELAMRALGNG